METAILACLILLNGLFAMSEVALLTARRTRLATLAAHGDALAATAAKLVAEPTRFLSAVQIGITAIGILNGIIGNAIFAAPFATWLVAQGLDNSAIARQLGKSEKTVRNQVSSIFDKLGVRTRAEAIVRVHSHQRGGADGE